MLKLELHSHTNHIQKNETNYSPKELIDKVSELGYDVLCITEHYFVHGNWPRYQQYPFKTYEDFKDYAKKKGILLMRGVELRFNEGEVVLINYHGDLSEIKKISDLKKIPKETLVMAPHPFFLRKNCLGKDLEKNISLFDAIEWSHFYTKSWNMNIKAKEIAEKYGKPMVGTSDVHMLFQLNHSCTWINARKDPRKIVEAIKQGKAKLVTKPMPIHLFIRLFASAVFFTAYFHALNRISKLTGTNFYREP
ncbi:MAG: PHP domain-containing protein [Candidatus Woesearchaeota archaeon]